MKTPLILAAFVGLATMAGAQQKAPAEALAKTSITGTQSSVQAPRGKRPIPTNVVTPPIISSSSSGGGTTIVFDMSATQSWDAAFDPSNTILTVPIPAGSNFSGIGWDLNLSTVGPSWLSEAALYFDGSDQDGTGLVLTPGVGNDGPGVMAFSSGGVLDLVDDLGIPDVPILGDGLLYIQLFETYDDVDDAVDADWTAPSTLTIVYDGAPGVPTVGEWGLIILGVVIAAGVAFLTLGKKPQAAITPA